MGRSFACFPDSTKEPTLIKKKISFQVKAISLITAELYIMEAFFFRLHKLSEPYHIGVASGNPGETNNPLGPFQAAE